MAILESVRLAIEGLLSNRLRTFLTMLGIIIGVGAVISVVSFGQGVEDFITMQFESLGANQIYVFSSTPPDGEASDVKLLTMADAEAIQSLAPSVIRVAPQSSALSLVVAGNTDDFVSVSGITPDYLDIRDWYPAYGRTIDETDILTNARVVILGAKTAEDFFGGSEDALGQTIKINSLPFRVIGVMEEKAGSGGFSDENEVIFAPISTVQTRLLDAQQRAGSYAVDTVTVQALSDERMDAAAAEIQRILISLHDIEYSNGEDFTVMSQKDLLEVVGQITGLLTIFLAVIAGISLLVGGIGIMNIMLVTVTERTREIGLRKAVGAKSHDILSQFLVESIVLTLSGGLLGIALGFAGAFAGTTFVPDLTLRVTMDSIMLATGVSTMIGLFFGIYPASRAASLNPIEALRYE